MPALNVYLLDGEGDGVITAADAGVTKSLVVTTTASDNETLVDVTEHSGASGRWYDSGRFSHRVDRSCSCSS